MYMALSCVAALMIFYVARDYFWYIKNDPTKHVNNASLRAVEPLKEGEVRPIIIEIRKNEMGGYSSMVYNRYGTHLTQENREHFVNILKYMVSKESELRSHKFKLLTFDKEKK